MYGKDGIGVAASVDRDIAKECGTLPEHIRGKVVIALQRDARTVTQIMKSTGEGRWSVLRALKCLKEEGLVRNEKVSGIDHWTPVH